MSSTKDKLKSKAKGKLATSKKEEKVKNPIIVNELDSITKDIKSSLEEMRDIAEFLYEKKIRTNELKEIVIQKLMYVRDNKKKLLKGLTFENYLTTEIGISKGYFYEQIQAYNLCLDYKKPELFQEVDHKVLVKIAREKDEEVQKELVEKAPSLTRDYFKKKKVSPTDFSNDDNIIDVTPVSDSSDVTVSLLDTMSIISNVFIDDEPKKTDHQKIEYSARLDATMRIMNLLQENDLIDKKESNKILKKLKKSII